MRTQRQEDKIGTATKTVIELAHEPLVGGDKKASNGFQHPSRLVHGPVLSSKG